MARRKMETEMETEEITNDQTEKDGNGQIEIAGVEYDPAFVLEKGFYLVDETLRLRTKDVMKGKPGTPQRRIQTVPICCRTIQAAKDVVSASGGNLGVLCVSEDGFRYPC